MLKNEFLVNGLDKSLNNSVPDVSVVSLFLFSILFIINVLFNILVI